MTKNCGSKIRNGYEWRRLPRSVSLAGQRERIWPKRMRCHTTYEIDACGVPFRLTPSALGNGCHSNRHPGVDCCVIEQPLLPARPPGWLHPLRVHPSATISIELHSAGEADRDGRRMVEEMNLTRLRKKIRTPPSDRRHHRTKD